MDDFRVYPFFSSKISNTDFSQTLFLDCYFCNYFATILYETARLVENHFILRPVVTESGWRGKDWEAKQIYVGSNLCSTLFSFLNWGSGTEVEQSYITYRFSMLSHLD